MDFKGTKGKWKLKEKTKSYKLSGDNWGDFCRVHKIDASGINQEEWDIEARANAKLISCAPELLETLIEIAFLANLSNEKQKEVNQLIKKATN